MGILQKELFTLGSFAVQLWHVLAVVLALVVIIVIICLATKGKKGKKQQPVGQPVKEQPAEEQQPVVAESAEKPVEHTVEDGVEVDVVTDEQPEADVEVAESETAAEIAEEQPATPTAPQKPRPKNYHVSLRVDGKWQVKLSKGGKAIKLFNTQLEAIAFAKERAKSQDGHITIHKVDGKIRKQKY